MLESEPGFTQPFHQLAIAGLVEKLPDALGHLGTHLFGLLQHLFVGMRDGVQASKRLGKNLRSPLTHERNAKAVQDAWQRARTRRVNILQNLLGRFLAHAFQLQKLIER